MRPEANVNFRVSFRVTSGARLIYFVPFCDPMV